MGLKIESFSCRWEMDFLKGNGRHPHSWVVGKMRCLIKEVLKEGTSKEILGFNGKF